MTLEQKREAARACEACGGIGRADNGCPCPDCSACEHCAGGSLPEGMAIVRNGDDIWIVDVERSVMLQLNEDIKKSLRSFEPDFLNIEE